MWCGKAEECIVYCKRFLQYRVSMAEDFIEKALAISCSVISTKEHEIAKAIPDKISFTAYLMKFVVIVLCQ
jgi:hypothetical protein